ncbi:MAG TPA: HEAT repeat domain-containing protein [Candidatus Hydrothermia bacterium]|nr:HEAT repeat domain-containing protein [Candidatus Hydrothermae bacterium]MDD3649166.1 HEAT repeat domain-containing protein [Candidatus Hydrothermia bacterium]MDD5572165.1 HEAT repeat domain-containing protein [Candidatus Hydrothermia bacterium]HOK23362.1 HEAT repeat domain-containing protein [Candidatus Hydrothermia bacterium]HOL24172.1 HEAT repeat domain-containing protein [Candidatus Hydrothermia bacterium]
MPGSRKKQGDIKSQEIEQLLKSPNILDRFKAVDILAEKRDVGKLISLLYSESWHLREKVQDALSQFTLNELRDKLLPLLNERMWFVRAGAIRVLGNLYAKEVVMKQEVEGIGKEIESEHNIEPMELMPLHLQREKDNELLMEAYNLIYPYLKERNEVVRANSAVALAKITVKAPAIKEKISKDDLIVIGNHLRELKEFALLEKFMNL